MPLTDPTQGPELHISTQVQLMNRPVGWPTETDFRTETVELPELSDGEVRVVNEFVSVDPYMRGRMSEARSYVAPFALGETMTGGAVGRVVASRAEGIPVGELVRHEQGWRDVAQGQASEFRVVNEVPGAASSVHLGILGMPGFTAWVGLLVVADLQEGDTVFVSGAAGAVGSTVGQIARLRGAKRVVGSAGSAEKVAALTERYGFDAAFSYRDGAIRLRLAQAAPGGIDVYFDNVGGDHLEAALGRLNQRGRAALCGAIGQYNATQAVPGPRNLSNVVTRSLRLQGFIVSDYHEHYREFATQMGAWLEAGAIVHDETVVDGIEHAVEAFLGMMRGENLGKMVVRTSG